LKTTFLLSIKVYFNFNTHHNIAEILVKKEEKGGKKRETKFGGRDLIRGVAFGGRDLIRGMAFGGRDLIRGMAFGGRDLIGGGLLYLYM
jgi:hypothetical protein